MFVHGTEEYDLMFQSHSKKHVHSDPDIFWRTAIISHRSVRRNFEPTGHSSYFDLHWVTQYGILTECMVQDRGKVAFRQVLGKILVGFAFLQPVL